MLKLSALCDSILFNQTIPQTLHYQNHCLVFIKCWEVYDRRALVSRHSHWTYNQSMQFLLYLHIQIHMFLSDMPNFLIYIKLNNVRLEKVINDTIFQAHISQNVSILAVWISARKKDTWSASNTTCYMTDAKRYFIWFCVSMSALFSI